MTDMVDKETRSRMMSAVRAKNTKLELEIRKRLFALKYRYRVHVKNMPGTPDMVFPKYHTVIFIHGCFWHYHECHLSTIPNTSQLWWKEKLEKNRNHDLKVLSDYANLEWRVIVIWECSFRKPKRERAEALEKIIDSIDEFLKSDQNRMDIQ